MQNLLNHAEQYVKDEHKTASKTAIHKTTEATGDLIGSKIANNITEVWRTYPQISSETYNIMNIIIY